jgi:hypothetical protein
MPDKIEETKLRDLRCALLPGVSGPEFGGGASWNLRAALGPRVLLLPQHAERVLRRGGPAPHGEGAKP